MSFYDPSKEADQIEKVEALETSAAEIKAKLNEMTESDAEWDTSRDAEYARLQLKHGEVHRELDYESDKLATISSMKPKSALPATEKNEHLEEFSAFIAGKTAKESFDLNLFDAFSTISPEMIIRGDNSSAQDVINTMTRSTVIDRLDSFGFEAGVPSMIVTPNGEPMKFPLADNTGSTQVGTRRTAQGQAVTEQDMADFTDVELKVDTIDAKRFQIPRELPGRFRVLDGRLRDEPADAQDQRHALLEHLERHGQHPGHPGGRQRREHHRVQRVRVPRRGHRSPACGAAGILHGRGSACGRDSA